MTPVGTTHRLTVPARIALGVGITAFTFALAVLLWTDFASDIDSAPGETFSLLIGFASFSAVGVAVAVRRPSHPIGWLFLGAGAYPMLQEALARLGELRMEEGSTTLFVIAHTAFSWPLFLGTLVVFVPLLFPTGHLPSPRWRWLAWTAGTAMGAMAIGGIIQRDICVTYDVTGNCAEAVPNPWGVSWLPSVEEGVFGAVMLGVLTVCMVGALVSVVVRYRRAHGVERVQLRWVVFAMGLFIVYMLVVGVLLEEILDLDAEIQSVVRFGIDPFGFFLALIPISVGVAILRYRLYDIDRLISRTVSYGLITAVLLACFAGAVFLSSRLFPRQSDLGVAASTLAVAALFNPVRRRIQSAVDRRFNRSRYDAARVVDAFGHRLRSEAGIENLTGELITAAATTMQPSTASLWLRTPRR